MTDSDDAWALVMSHRYAGALQIYDKILKGDPSDQIVHANRGYALLGFGKLTEALVAFQTASDIEQTELRGRSNGYQTNIGAINWLLDRKRVAKNVFETGTKLIRNGSVEFTDQAGGASEGLLFYYAYWKMSLVEGSEHDPEGYLNWISENGKIQYWPGPLVLFLLGRIPKREVLRERFGSDDVDEIGRQAATNLLIRRDLVRTLFYFGVASGARGREEEYRVEMRACAKLQNPILENEWYLARHELGISW